MGWGAIVSSVSPQTGSVQSQVATGVNLSSTINEGTITAASNWSGLITEGQAFIVFRSGAYVCARCVKSISTTTLTYYRLYLEDGIEDVSDIRVGDTIIACERAQSVGSGTGMGSVAGFTLAQSGTGATAQNHIFIGNNGLSISGNFQFHPNDRIMLGPTAPTPNTIQVLAGGNCVLGSYRTANGVTSFSTPTILCSTRNQLVGAFLIGSSTSMIDWFGGVIDTGGTINSQAGGFGRIRIYSKRAVLRGNNITVQLRLSSANDRVDGVTCDNCGGIVPIGTPILKNCVFLNCDIAFGPSSSTPANSWRPVNSPDFSGGNNVDAAYWSSRQFRYINPSTHNFIAVGNLAGFTASNRGIMEARQELYFNIKDPIGNGIDSLYYISTTDNGERIGANQIGVHQSYLVNDVYEGRLSAGSGAITANGGVLVSMGYQNIPNASVDRNGDVHRAWMGLGATGADRYTFRVLLSCYGFLPKQVNVLMGGTSGNLLLDTQQTDAGITASRATASAYTDLIDGGRLYDAAALWLDTPGGNHSVVGGGNQVLGGAGGSIDGKSRSLTLDATASAVFAASLTTVTAKATAMAKTSTWTRLTNFASVTLANGASCAIDIVMASGVLSVGPLGNLTGAAALTGTARLDFSGGSGAVASAGSAAAGTTVRCVSALSGAIIDFRAFSFNASSTFENTSGQPVVLRLGPGQQRPVLLATSGTITVNDTVAYSINGWPTGTTAEDGNPRNQVGVLFEATPGWDFVDRSNNNSTLTIDSATGTTSASLDPAKKYLLIADAHGYYRSNHIRIDPLAGSSTSISLNAIARSDGSPQLDGSHDAAQVSSISWVGGEQDIAIDSSAIVSNPIITYQSFLVASEKLFTSPTAVIEDKPKPRYDFASQTVYFPSGSTFHLCDKASNTQRITLTFSVLRDGASSAHDAFCPVWKSTYGLAYPTVFIAAPAQVLASSERAAVAGAVRSELTTELGRIDVNTSSRLASTSYSAPDNAGIASAKSAAEAVNSRLPSDPADQSAIDAAIAAIPAAPSAVAVANAVWAKELP